MKSLLIPFKNIICITLMFLLLARSVTTASVSECSSQNTGSGKHSSSEYMSNGFCSDKCEGYAYAIVSGKDCYCSNYAPSSTTDDDNCDTNCPGYPYEKCAGNGYYGYIQIGQPSGTSSSKSSTSTSSSTSESSTSSSSSSSESSTSSTSTDSPSSSSEQESTMIVTKTSTREASGNSKGQTLTSVIIVTESDSSDQERIVRTTSTVSGGSSIKVITSVLTSSFSTSMISKSSSDNSSSSLSSSLTSSASASPSSVAAAAAASATSSSSASTTPVAKSSKSFWDSPGKVGGTFASVGIIILVLIALVMFGYIRRRYNQNNQLVSAANQSGGYAVAGNIDSTNGSTLMNSPVAEKNSHRFINDGDTIIPIPFGGDVDQRLDPGQMFYNNLGVDAESKKSISDEYDYSRKFLRVANPDVGLRSFVSKNSVRDSVIRDEKE